MEASLTQIKGALSKKVTEPVKVNGDITELKKQIKTIDDRLSHLKIVQKDYTTEGQKFMVVGEIKNAFEQLLKREEPKPIDIIKLNRLNDEKMQLDKKPAETEQIKHTMRELLNESIEGNFNRLTSIPSYKNSNLSFNTDKMILQL